MVWIAISLALLCAGIQKAVKIVKGRRAPSNTPLLYFHQISVVGCLLSFGILLLSLSLSGPGSSRGAVAVFLILGAAFALLIWISNAIRRSMDRNGEEDIKKWTVERFRWVRGLLCNMWTLISPPGIKEVGRIDQALDNALGIRGLLGCYLIALVSSPLLMAPALVWSLETVPAQIRPAIRSVLGFNALGMATCVAVCFIATIMLLAIACRVGILKVTPDIRRSFEMLVGCIGNFSMAGLLTAALVPLFASPRGFGSGTQVRLSPSILIDLPAVFAAIGAIFGMVVGATMILERADNLLLRRFLPAATYAAVVLVCMHYFGLAPGEVFLRSTAGTESLVTSCDVPLLEERLSDGAFLIYFVRRCGGGNWLVSDEIYAWGSILVASFSALILFSRDVVSRNRKRLADLANRSRTQRGNRVN